MGITHWEVGLTRQEALDKVQSYIPEGWSITKVFAEPVRPGDPDWEYCLQSLGDKQSLNSLWLACIQAHS